jgi:hypothetical protein
VRLPGVQGGPLGRRIRCGVQQPADPRGVGGAGRDAVDPDPLADVVGRHRLGQGQHGALAGRVERALRDPGGGRDRAGVDDGRRRRPAQVRQRRAGHPDDAEHVDLEHPAPLVELVGLDRALGADAGVVDHDVDATEPLGRGGHPGADRVVVGHVDGEAGQSVGQVAGPQVEDGDGGAPLGQQARRGQPDPAGATGDDRLEPGEFAPARCPLLGPHRHVCPLYGLARTGFIRSIAG